MKNLTNSKVVFALAIMFFLFNKLNAQCDIKINKRPDGTTVKYLNPELIGKGNNCELGLSVSTNGDQFFLNTTVLYYSNPKKLINYLVLELSNNSSIELKIVSSELAKMNNYQVSLGVFGLTAADLKQLKENKIKKIVFQEIDKKYQIINTNNSSIISRQINCFK